MILGIDVGGTHTDAVLLDHSTVRKKAKVLTNEKNLLSSLLAATTELVDEDIIGKIERVVLSTTLSTNAIVQNKVDRVGMMVVSGPGLHPSLLSLPEDTHVLSGYVNHRGIEISPVDPSEAVRIGALFHDEGIRHIGIVAKFSTRNPQQETCLKESVAPFPFHISLGHRMSGHLNFPTAHCNHLSQRGNLEPLQPFRDGSSPLCPRKENSRPYIHPEGRWRDFRYRAVL